MVSHKEGGTVIGIDFRRRYTVIISVPESSGCPQSLQVPGISRIIPAKGSRDGIHVIPTAIHYDKDGGFYIGEKADSAPESASSPTIRNLVYYIGENSPVMVSAGADRAISYARAGADFLARVVATAIGDGSPSSVQVVFTIPLAAGAHYREWLLRTADEMGLSSASAVDSASALARGLGLPVDEGDYYIIIDANPDNLEVSVILFEQEKGDKTGLASTVIGISATDFGGSTVDSWIASDLVLAWGRYIPHDDAHVFANLVTRCRKAREELAISPEVHVRFGDLLRGKDEDHILTRQKVENVFQKKGLFTLLDGAISRASSAARTSGFEKDKIRAVIVTGEVSLFPAFQAAVRKNFNDGIVKTDYVLDAAARGAVQEARFQSRTINADYALRYWNPVSREHRYRFLVRKGARFPSQGQVARVIISAAYDGQEQLGLPLYRIADNEMPNATAGIELLGSPDGSFHIAGLTGDCGKGCSVDEVNRTSPTFLMALPPARKSEPRFELTFSLDSQGYLCLAARDLVNGRIVKDAERILKLA